MRIELLSLSLENFKGITLQASFSRETTILGANGSGKTSLYDSFLWLLFGKDSSGRTDYELKKRLTDRSQVQRTNISVTGIFLVNGVQKEFKRTFTEQWVTKRGSSEQEFKGNQTSYEVDGVPKSAGEYSSLVSSIIDESIFRLVCSSTYFVSLKWQDKRAMLLQAAGEPTLEEISSGNEEFIKLVNLASGKTMDEFRKMIKSKKSLIKDQKDNIKPKIEQEKTHIIDLEDPSPKIEANNKKIESLEKQISGLLNGVEEANKDVNKKIAGLYSAIGQLETEKLSIENTHKSEYNKNIQNHESEKREVESSIKNASAELFRLENEQLYNSNKVKLSKEALLEIGKQYKEAQSGKLDNTCPTCGATIPEEELEGKRASILKGLEEQGTAKKAKYLQDVENETNFAEKIKEAQEKLSGLRFRFQELSEKTFKHFVTEYNEDPRHKEIVTLIEANKNEIEEITSFKQEEPDSSSLKESISLLRAENDKLKQNLFLIRKSNESKQSVKELEEKEQALSIELSELEKTEITADQFTKKKLDMVSEKVNSMFSLVDWDMFETQINGGEKEICECSVKGVPYGTLNAALKTNVGLDIINAFSKKYDVYAPIWIDNRESVTDLIPTDTQLISLIVSPSNKTLKFE